MTTSDSWLSRRRRKLVRRLYRRLRTRHEVLADKKLIRMLDIGMKHCIRKIEVIFEVGANDGRDGDLMREYFGVRPENVFLFEPHPELAREIARTHPRYRLYEMALSDFVGRATFNASPVSVRKGGLSTLGTRTLVTGRESYRPVEVAVDTLDHVMEGLPEVHIDLMKIDVEGFTFRVLSGGEKTLREKVAVLQLENEVTEVYQGQKLYPEVAHFLESLGFIETYMQRGVLQNDTVWVHERYRRKAGEFVPRVAAP